MNIEEIKIKQEVKVKEGGRIAKVLSYDVIEHFNSSPNSQKKLGNICVTAPAWQSNGITYYAKDYAPSELELV